MESPTPVVVSMEPRNIFFRYVIKEDEIREWRRRYSLLDYVIIQAPGTYDGDSDFRVH